jgi:hypothetical protein
MQRVQSDAHRCDPPGRHIASARWTAIPPGQRAEPGLLTVAATKMWDR